MVNKIGYSIVEQLTKKDRNRQRGTKIAGG